MGRLIARVAVGLLFAGHGVQKVFGWFGGPGPEVATGIAGSALVIEAGKRTPAAQQTSPGAVQEPAADVPAAAHA